MLRILAFLLFLPTALLAQSAPRTILVLDGSGSMWGQIDGVNKIVIAREVMADLLATLPAEQELGLMSYGHRRKGDCDDIELLIEPGTDRAAIADAVNAINPKGKTPLSAAVLQAAQALRYTEEVATVILVSDGIETCDLDPCAVGRELEQAGVGFTAHVIGFDVADPTALAQLKCLAAETGGQFRTADNADELAGALQEIVVAEPEPMPVSTVVTFRAIDGPGGAEITEGLIWNIGTEDAGEIVVNDDEPTQLLDIFPGTGLANVIRLADEASAEATFTIAEGDGPQTITLVLPAFLPAATVTGPATAAVGSVIPVAWTGPNLDHDKILVLAVGDTDDPHQDYAFTSEGTPVQLSLPTTPGSYELRYVMTAGNKVLATQPITVTDVDATLDAPDSAAVGTELSIGWTGPDADRDYIAIVPAGADHRDRVAYAYTGNGNPARFDAPVVPGAYDLLYVLNANGTRELARRPITLTEVGATLTVPATAAAGSEVTFDFTGPGDERDSIILTYPDAAATQAEELDSEAARNGSPMTFRLPVAPGSYEVRYLLGGRHGEILARAQIEATAVSATLTAPADAPVGSEITIAFTGPAEQYDSIILTYPDAAATQAEELDSEAARNGSPLKMRLPLVAGVYEVRYLHGGRHGEILDRALVEATAVTATVEGPATAFANDAVAVAFTGPAEDLDIVTIAPAGSDSDDYVNSAKASAGSPAELDVPRAPGDYVLRYQLGGRHGEILAEQPISVTLPEASLTAPATSVAAGADFEVAFTGPDFANDIIAVVPSGAAPSERIESTRTSRSNPSEVRAPAAPGSYDLVYALGGKWGPVLARVPLTVTAP